MPCLFDGSAMTQSVTEPYSSSTSIHIHLTDTGNDTLLVLRKIKYQQFICLRNTIVCALMLCMPSTQKHWQCMKNRQHLL